MEKKRYDLHKIGSAVFRTAGVVALATETLGLGVFFYLATFIRYVADDFCEIALLKGRPVLSVVFEKYVGGSNRSANRFSKFFLVNLTELLGKHDVQLLPIVMIFLWLLGLIWLIQEVRKRIGIQRRTMAEILMAVSIVFFSITQAPNLFQIYFWRSSSLTHFAPMVFYLLLGDFVLFQIRSAQGNTPKPWVPLTVFILSFVIGGAGETPTFFMLVVNALLLFYFWRRQPLERRPGLVLTTSAFAGTFLAFCALFFAPANFAHGKTSLIALPTAVLESLKFSFQFIWDTVLILPIPTLVSILLPGLLFFCLYINPGEQPLLLTQKRHIVITLILLPLLSYLLIAVSFTPSAYAQSYPIERARFIGRFIMTAALMFEGALLGVWFAQLKTFLSFQHLIFPIAGFFLLIVAFYPIRSALWLWSNVESYREWSLAWDERDATIKSKAEAGEQDLVVEWSPNTYGIKDIDGSTKHWVNRCISDYYGINSIRSVPTGE